MSAPPPIRALVVGAGETSALIHLPVLAALRDQGRLALAEICDVVADRSEAARRRFGFARAGGDALAALGRADIDAVYLFGDARMHHTLGLVALGAGKHLFVEKPIAPGFAEACDLARLAEARGLIAAGGHNRRFYRTIAETRRRGGKAGWHQAQAVFHKAAAGQPPPFGARSWLTANGIHALDALLFLMGGPPDHLAAAANDETFSALMRWPGGAQGLFLCDNRAGARREDYTAHAPGLTVQADDAGLRIEADGRATRLALPALGDGFAAEHAAFLDAITTGVAPLHAIATLAPSLRIAELIEEGYEGPMTWPAPRPARPSPRPRIEGALLLVNAGRLKGALAARPTGRPIVSLADLSASDAARPEIVAVLLGTGPEVLTPKLLDRLPNLAVAGLAGLSFARHAPEALLARDVALVNASEAYAESVAEFALGLVILARRQAFSSDRALRAGGWGTAMPPTGWRRLVSGAARSLWPLAHGLRLERSLLGLWRGTAPKIGLASPLTLPSRNLRGARLGLIGWGANARAFATRLIAAGASVAVWSEHAADETIRAAGAVPAALAEVLAAEIVSLHRGLSGTTRHAIGAAELARLRPGVILINVARGALIEPAALLTRLRQGDVFACLDVFEEEPLPKAHPLRRLPNVFLTAHIAGGSPDMHAAAAVEVIGKIERHLAGNGSAALPAGRLLTMT